MKTNKLIMGFSLIIILLLILTIGYALIFNQNNDADVVVNSTNVTGNNTALNHTHNADEITQDNVPGGNVTYETDYGDYSQSYDDSYQEYDDSYQDYDDSYQEYDDYSEGYDDGQSDYETGEYENY